MPHEVKGKADLTAQLNAAGDKLVVIDFYAVWCGPCKRIAPVLDQIAKDQDGKVIILKVDVDENEELVHEYKITMMPTFVLMRKGTHLDTFPGSSEVKLKELIDKHLA